jgi:hypothetical protein
MADARGQAARIFLKSPPRQLHKQLNGPLLTIPGAVTGFEGFEGGERGTRSQCYSNHQTIGDGLSRRCGRAADDHPTNSPSSGHIQPNHLSVMMCTFSRQFIEDGV